MTKPEYSEFNYDPSSLLGKSHPEGRIIGIGIGILENSVEGSANMIIKEVIGDFSNGTYKPGQVYYLSHHLFQNFDRSELIFGLPVHTICIDGGRQYNFITRKKNKRIYRPFTK
jgi:hypothetical protein